jgi:hypothetical protein
MLGVLGLKKWAKRRYYVWLFSSKIDIVRGGVTKECHFGLRVFIELKDSIAITMFEILRHITVECPYRIIL